MDDIEQARWDDAARRVLEREIAADRERETKAAVATLKHEAHGLVSDVKAYAADVERKAKARTFADDRIAVTTAERRAALKAELKAINAELATLAGIDPVEQDRKAHEILAEFGMLDENVSDES